MAADRQRLRHQPRYPADYRLPLHGGRGCYVLAVHKDNPVKELTAAEIKAVFDEDITRWSELGGPDMEIVTFRLEDADEYFTEEELGAQYEYAAGKIDSLIAATPGMIAFIPESMVEEGAQLNLIEDNAISPAEVLGGSEWFPTATPAPLFGMWPLLAGTLWVSFFAILFALPFGISSCPCCSRSSACRWGRADWPAA